MCNLYHHSIDNRGVFETLKQASVKPDELSRDRNYPPDYTGGNESLRLQRPYSADAMTLNE